MIHTPPLKWEQDELSSYIVHAINNTFATFNNRPEWYDLLSNIDSIFLKLVENLDNNRELFSSFLIFKTHSSYRAATRFLLSGQLTESFPILRLCIENSLCSLYLLRTKDKERWKRWLSRHDSNKSKAKVRDEFKNSNMFQSLKEESSGVYGIAKKLYELTIDYGAHPNERALLSTLVVEEKEESARFQINYLLGEKEILFAIKIGSDVAICCLEIIKFVFKERFELLGLSGELEKVKRKQWFLVKNNNILF